MFGLGNKKRIEELEDRVELMARIIGGRLAEIDCKVMEANIHDHSEETAEKCFNCRIKTGVRIKGTKAVGGETITTHYIPVKEAIEKIMDQLGIEFDHIDAKPSDTVIKPKETP